MGWSEMERRVALEAPQLYTAHPWSLTEMQTWTKWALEVTKITQEKYLTYVKGTIHSKSGCNMELQTSEEAERCKVLTA